MKIGKLFIDNSVFLAPMAGVTDLPFRRLVKQMGCGLLYTEMVSAKGLIYGNEVTAELMRFLPEEEPISIQIFGSEPAILAEAARIIEAEQHPAIIDINMGCPTPKIVNNGDGSALMREPKLAGQIVAAVVSATKLPVTVKIRKGWDDKNVNAVEIARILEANGAKAIAIHGRTREQFYSGQADWQIIQAVKDSVQIPVIGNGDIFTPEDAKAMLEMTGCDAVMVGRGSQGNPWLFRQITHYLQTGEILPPPTPRERIELAIAHLRTHIAYKGEELGVPEMRKHIAWHLKGLPNSNKVKEKIFRLFTATEIITILQDFLLEVELIQKDEEV